MTSPALLEVRGLRVDLAVRGSPVGRRPEPVRALDGVSLVLRRGEVLGLVGESGAGKTTLARSLLGLVSAAEGSIRVEGEEITGLREAALRRVRRRLAIVPQDPLAALNPALTIGAGVADPLRFHRIVTGRRALREAAKEALDQVGLTPARRFLDAYPGDLSGGQCQRAVLARALILRPVALVADEPVSMLDASARASILQLMATLRRQRDIGELHITHDLPTARLVCDRIAVMRRGQIVECGPAEEVCERPRDPYTAALLAAAGAG